MKIFISSLLILLSLSSCGGGDTPTTTPDAPERLTFIGTGNLGEFDPSVTRDTSSGKLWMSYSSVNTSPNYASTLYWAVSIRLASSDDNGTTWQDAGVVAAAVEKTDFGPMPEEHPTGSIPANTKGIWQSEMSSLVYDSNPATPTNERWKLIWVQYFHGDLTSYFADYSWISMKMASTPAGLVSATAVKLFAGAGLQADNSIAADPVYAPIAGAPVIQLNTDLTNVVGSAQLSELDLCIFAEPGLHATNNAIYLSIYCADASPLTEYIVNFRCNSPCNMTDATSWEYLGRVLSATDAQAATNDHHFQAPAIVEKNGKIYLIVTPVNTTSINRYNGCRVYEFSDIDSNTLRRTNGQLVEVKRIDGESNTHNGACAAFSGLDGGVLLSQFGIAGSTSAFKIIKTQISLP